MDVTIPIDPDSNYEGGGDFAAQPRHNAVHRLSVEEAERAMATDISNGLSQEEVLDRRRKYGSNILPQPRQRPLWKALLRNFTDLFSLMLQFAAILCIIAYILEPTEISNLFLGLFLYLVVIVTSLFAFLQQYKSDKTLREFRTFLPLKSTVVRAGGRVQVVPASELVLGDIVKIKLGDKIPADIRIVKNSQLRVDNSSLTGESEPLTRTVNMTAESPLETSNLAFVGCLAVDGTAEGIVVATGANTVFGKIVMLTTEGDEEEAQTTLQKDMHHFVVNTAVFSFGVGLIFFIAGLLNRTKLLHNLVYSIGIIVSNVPEGLVATVTVALTASAHRMAARNVLVKKLDAIESLGSSTVICSDKTGTLTRNRMHVSNIYYADRVEKADRDWMPPQVIPGEEVSGVKNCFDSLFFGAAMCSTAVFDDIDLKENPDRPVEDRVVCGDASEAGILRFAEKIQNVEFLRLRSKLVASIPFNSTNKYMVTVNFTDPKNDTLRVLMKGAPEKVLEKCSSVLTAGGAVPFSDERRASIQNEIDRMANVGERVLGFAELEMSPQETTRFMFEGGDDIPREKIPVSDLTFVGLVSLKDPPREGVDLAVQKCRSAGLRAIMITGDHPGTARSIAKQVGIITLPVEALEATDAPAEGISGNRIAKRTQKAVVIQGTDIAGFSRNDWDRALSHEEIVFARTSPEQKLVIVKELQRLKEIVAVTGDGVNDAPALKQAETGIAMGLSGSEVSKEAADIVLLDDNFTSIVNGVEEGRLIFDNLKKSIAYSLTSNVPQLMPFMAFVLFHIPVPLTTILVLSIDLGTDIFPAISLAYENPESDLMARPPRDAKSERLLNPRLISYAMLQMGMIQSLAGFFAYFCIMYDFGLSPIALVGLDHKGRFGSPKATDQRWMYSLQSRDRGVGYAAGWFHSKDRHLKPYFATRRPGFTEQRQETFAGLKFSAVPGSSSAPLRNSQFNNMLKILGHETRLPSCQEYACQVGGKRVRSDKACFDPQKNAGPVVLVGASDPRAPRKATSRPGGCFRLWTPGEEREVLRYGQTAFFAAIVVAQAFTIFVCKTRVLSLFQHGNGNNVLLLSIVLEFMVACVIIYVPLFQHGFGVRPLKFWHWLPGVPFGLFIIAYDEIRKWFIRKDLYASRKAEGEQGSNGVKKIASWVRRTTLW